MENTNKKNSLRNNISTNINTMSNTNQQELTPAATGNSKYSKQIQKMKDKINKLENE